MAPDLDDRPDPAHLRRTWRTLRAALAARPARARAPLSAKATPRSATEARRPVWDAPAHWRRPPDPSER